MSVPAMKSSGGMKEGGCGPSGVRQPGRAQACVYREQCHHYAYRSLIFPASVMQARKVPVQRILEVKRGCLV